MLAGKATLTVGGEEHELEPGVFARVGPRRDAKADHRRRGSAGPRDRRRAREGLRAARVHRGGPAGPDGELAAEPAPRLAEQVLARAAAGWRRAPGPSSAVTKRPSPRTIAAGHARSLSRTRSAAAATSSATAITVAASSRPMRSRRPRQSSSGSQAGAADRDVRLAEPPGAAEAVGDHHGRARRPPRRAISARIRRAEASGVLGQQGDAIRRREFEASMPALAQIQPLRVSDDQDAALGAHHAAGSRTGPARPGAGPCRAARPARWPARRAPRRRARAPAPRPSRRPSGRRPRRRRPPARSPALRQRRGDQLAERVAGCDLGQAATGRSRARGAHRAGAAR